MGKFEKLVRFLGPLSWVPVVVLVNDNLVSVAPVPDDLMEPVVERGEWLLVNKLAPKMYKWNRNDVVLIRSPFNPGEQSIRRITAMENDWIFPKRAREGGYVQNGHCWVEGDSGHPTLEPFIPQQASPTLRGPVPLALVAGRVSYVIWPLNRLRKIQ